MAPRNPIVLIPTRLASNRLPNKPLADIHGRPMILHVVDRANEADLGPVVVACGDREIYGVVSDAGTGAVMTDPDHASGSDRIFEALQSVDPGGRHDAIINFQGDLPTIDPDNVRAAFQLLQDDAVDIGTLACLITDGAERDDPAVVKAVLALHGGSDAGRTLYFSRAAVPAGPGDLYHHIGLYVYRRESLTRFVALHRGVLEQRERLEQLRALEAGMRIDAAIVDTVPLGVDTPADLDRARAILAPGRAVE